MKKYVCEIDEEDYERIKIILANPKNDREITKKCNATYAVKCEASICKYTSVPHNGNILLSLLRLNNENKVDVIKFMQNPEEIVCNLMFKEKHGS